LPRLGSRVRIPSPAPSLFPHQIRSAAASAGAARAGERMTSGTNETTTQPMKMGIPEIRGHSSAGRALQWHCRGQRFDPAWLHHPPLRGFKFDPSGGVAEWLKAADCKSARDSVRWFESSPLHHDTDHRTRFSDRSAYAATVRAAGLFVFPIPLRSLDRRWAAFPASHQAFPTIQAFSEIRAVPEFQWAHPAIQPMRRFKPGLKLAGCSRLISDAEKKEQAA
jgi:hypothetical protein